MHDENNFLHLLPSAAATGASTSVSPLSRDQIQQEAFSAWVEHDCKGAVVVGTGVGKTKTAMLTLDYFFKARVWLTTHRVLWLTNSEKLRDTETPADFEKWNCGWMLEHITFECYQTAYKWQDTEWDFVIADEADFALAPELSKFFHTNRYQWLLFMTATVKEEKMEYLWNICPIVYQYSTQQAQADGLLNQTKFILVEVELSQAKTIKRHNASTGKDFFVSEASVYEYWETEFAKAIQAQEKLKENFPLSPAEQKDFDKREKQIQNIVAQRSKVLWESPTLVAAAKQIARKILRQEGTKVVLFSKRQSTAELLGSNVYHSGNKKDSTAIEDFNSGKFRGLSVVDAINRGQNLVGATHFIYVGYHSSDVDFQQRHGRGTRLALDEVGYHIILLPYYTTKAGVRKPTQAVRWSDKMMVQFETSQADRVTLNEYLTT